MPTERNRTSCVACPRFIFSSRTNICKAVFLPSPLSTLTRHVEKCFDIFSPVRNFPRGFFFFVIYVIFKYFLKKKYTSKSPQHPREACWVSRLSKQLKTAWRIRFKPSLEFILFPHANEQRRRRDKAHCGHGARRPGRPAPHTLQTCARCRFFRNRFVSTLVRAFLLSEKKSERGEINRVRFRRLSEHAAAAEEPRAAAVTCLTCPGFFPPVALSVSRSPLLPSFLSLYPPSLSRSLARSLPLFTSNSAATRATSFSCCSRSNMACAHVQSHVQIFTQPLCGRLRGQQKKNPEKKENENNLN